MYKPEMILNWNDVPMCVKEAIAWNLHTRMIASSKSRKEKGAGGNASTERKDVELSYNDILKLLIDSNGCCAKTGIRFPLVTNSSFYDKSYYDMFENFNSGMIPVIDRKNSNFGYISGNVQIVTRFINDAKNNRTDDELDEFLKSINFDYKTDNEPFKLYGNNSEKQINNNSLNLKLNKMKQLKNETPATDMLIKNGFTISEASEMLEPFKNIFNEEFKKSLIRECLGELQLDNSNQKPKKSKTKGTGERKYNNTIRILNKEYFLKKSKKVDNIDDTYINLSIHFLNENNGVSSGGLYGSGIATLIRSNDIEIYKLKVKAATYYFIKKESLSLLEHVDKSARLKTSLTNFLNTIESKKTSVKTIAEPNYA